MLTKERLKQLREIAEQYPDSGFQGELDSQELLELLDAEERLTKVETFAHTIAPMPGPVKASNGPKLKSVPDHPKMQHMAHSLIGNVVMLLRQEIEHSPPDKRNRMTLALFWEDEEWNLTLAKGKYESLMEEQRDQARADRDHWMKQALGPVDPPTNNDHEQDGN